MVPRLRDPSKCFTQEDVILSTTFFVGLPSKMPQSVPLDGMALSAVPIQLMMVLVLYRWLTTSSVLGGSEMESNVSLPTHSASFMNLGQMLRPRLPKPLPEPVYGTSARLSWRPWYQTVRLSRLFRCMFVYEMAQLVLELFSGQEPCLSPQRVV